MRLALWFGVLVGCSSSSSDPELAGMADFKARMCACRDRACADRVDREYQAWGETVTRPTKRTTSESDARGRGEKVDALEAELRACKRTARRR